MSPEPLYLDANATTPLHPRVRTALIDALDRFQANPSSSHQAGSRARAALEEAREVIRGVFGVPGAQVIFTSGGTEANQLGLWSLARRRLQCGDPQSSVVCSPVEHPAVLRAVEWLCHEHGWDLRKPPMGMGGAVKAEKLLELVDDTTAMVALMHANNETGAIQPVRVLSKELTSRGVPLHVDTVQSWGKARWPSFLYRIATWTVSAHKIGGPKGVGALIAGPDVPILPILPGGSQESGHRGGTPNLPGIVAFAEAARVLQESWTEAEYHRQCALREDLWIRLARSLPGLVRLSPPEESLANTLNLALPGRDAALMVIGLDLRGIAVSTGSACASGTTRPSPTLEAMNLPTEVRKGALRLSFLPTLTEDDLPRIVDAFTAVAG